MRRFNRLICRLPSLLAVANSALAQVGHAAPATPVLAHNGMVVAQEQRAARIGVEILDRGGNAVDAAVAVGFALAVTYPRAGNIGGGGFMVIHLAKDSTRHRDRLSRDRAGGGDANHVSRRGTAMPIRRSRAIPRCRIGVPGTVAGLALAHEKYGSGKLTLAELIAPAIQLAREGFRVEDDLADSLPRAQRGSRGWPSSAADLSSMATAAASRRPAAAVRSRRHAGSRSRATGRAPSTRARSPPRSPMPCAPPAAS